MESVESNALMHYGNGPAEFNDPMTGAWICGTKARGYSPAWELLPFRSHNADSRHRLTDFGAVVLAGPGQYFVVRWEDDKTIPFDVYYRTDDGLEEHLGSISRISDVRGIVEHHRGLPSKKSLPRIIGGFTDLPVGTAFIDTGGSWAQVRRIVSRGKRRTQFHEIEFSDLIAGETVHVPHADDWDEVISAKPNGYGLNDFWRKPLRDRDRALVPDGVILLEYPERSARA